MRYLTILLFTALYLLSAATFTVTQQESGSDLTAIQADIRDVNGKMCGMVRIYTDLKDFAFTPNPAKVIYKTGEVQVFLSPGARKIVIAKEGFAKKEWIFPTSLDAGTVYKIELAANTGMTGDIPVNIIATPNGATLFVDGVDKGVTETAQLAAGKHKIRLEKAGFAVVEADITVSLQNTLFKYPLVEEDPAKLKISSEPAGAAVYLDGAKIGVTPFTKFYPPGKYKIKIEKEAFETIEEQLTIKLPETVKNYNLTDNSAFLTIKTSPKATVYINDERVTSLTNIRLAPQFVEIKVTMPRAKDLSRKIMLKKGERQTIDLMPEIAMGKIQVAVTPDDADLTLTDEDGQNYSAKGSNIFKNMPVGRYELSAKQDGYKIGKASIVLSADQVASKELVLQKGADVGGDFVFVQGGTFSMGSNENENEKPIHSVTVSDFYIGKYEVTVGDFKEFVNASGYRTEAETGDGAYIYTTKWEKKSDVNWKNPYFSQTDKDPVTCVSWNDAQAYIKWLNTKTGKKYRLPTEAEWEYAARGGVSTSSTTYSGSNNIDEVAWYYKNSGSKTRPIGQKQANKFGIYDMSGNVWEWCSDWYGSYSSSSQTNPQGAAEGSYRVYRGGSWYYNASYCRVAYRNDYAPVIRSFIIGFRLAL